MLQSKVSSSSQRAQKLHEAFQNKPSSLVARETDGQGREECWGKPITAERYPKPKWDTAQVVQGSDWLLIPARPVLTSLFTEDKILKKNKNKK